MGVSVRKMLHHGQHEHPSPVDNVDLLQDINDMRRATDDKIINQRDVRGKLAISTTLRMYYSLFKGQRRPSRPKFARLTTSLATCRNLTHVAHATALTGPILCVHPPATTTAFTLSPKTYSTSRPLAAGLSSLDASTCRQISLSADEDETCNQSVETTEILPVRLAPCLTDESTGKGSTRGLGAVRSLPLSWWLYVLYEANRGSCHASARRKDPHSGWEDVVLAV